MSVIILPNEIIFAEVKERIRRGESTSIPLSGISMSPLLPDKGCQVTLSPIDGELMVGDVVLFTYHGHEILHRIIRIDGDLITFQGDNLSSTETTHKNQVIAKLTRVTYQDGRTVDCNSREWHQMSEKSLRRKHRRNAAIRLMGRAMRKKLRPWYFIFLAILMWAPLNGLAAQFPNYVLGLRADHFVHASVFILCAPFLMDLFIKTTESRLRSTLQLILLWICCALVGATTECGQILLPYRGFDVNDLVANFSGATLGCLIVAAYSLRSQKS